MEEEISRMKIFLKEFNNDQIQSPTSDEITYTRVGNYGLDPEDVTGQVIDWVLNYLDNRKCPYSLALSVAKEAAQQVSASYEALSQSDVDDVEKSANSAALYAEAISKISAICNSLSQTNLEPGCSTKYATSVFAIKNKRRKMEDSYVIHHDLNAVLDLKDVPHQSYYAVFDGHSGRYAACYASAQLHMNIAKHPDFLTDTPKAIIEGYQITDLNFLNKCNKWSNIKSGCTVVSALIRENTVYLSWLGDSQAVLVKEGVPLTITNPHKPDREDEKLRIESLGGHVSHVGTWRVNGLLAVTRAIGDPDQKRFISSEPELSVLNLDGTEDFLILACDGLWDGMSPEDVTGVLYRYLADSSPDEPLDAVAAKLVHQSKLQGSEDNITAIVIFLRDIKTIKENSAKFLTSSYCIQNHDFISINGSMKTLDLEHVVDTPFSKPTVLELNAASSKKLKNAANVMSSTGFGSSSYSYQYAENTAEGAFQNLDASVMDTAQSVFRGQNVTASCFAPEATALSELPTPPIDDMLASQQSENFYSTDLYKELSNSVPPSQIVEVNSSVDSNIVGNETFQPPSLDSPSKPADSMIADISDTSLLNTESISFANPDAKISPDEAVGVASTVVSSAIETAVKCLSSSESTDSVPAPSPKKLNPLAKPFVMKSFFSTEESESKTLVDSEASDASLTSDEKHSTKLDNQFMTDISTDLLAENRINQSGLDNVELKQLHGDGTSQSIAGNTMDTFIRDQVSQSVVDFVSSEQFELGIANNKEQDRCLDSKSNPPEQLINQTVEGNISDSFKSEVNSSSFLKEDVTNVIDTNSVLNSDIAQKCSSYDGSTISFEGSVIKDENLETGHEENKLNVSDLPVGNTSISAAGENVIADINDLPTSDACKDANLSAVSNESSFANSKIPEQKLLLDVSDQSSILDLSELCQNMDSSHISADLISENSSVISENKSKQDTNEKCIVDVTKNDHLESTHLLDNLINQLPSSVNILPDLMPVEIVAKPPTQESPKEFSTPAGSLPSCLPSDNQNSSSGNTSENILSGNFENESKSVTIEKNIVDAVEKNIIETSQLINCLPSEPISLIDIKNELIPPEAEVPSVEDSQADAVAVDLKSLPVGIPEAEGVTEDVDSDSEKDGGWSYMKGNTVSGSKSKSANKMSETLKSKESKSNVTTKTRRDLSKPNLDAKSKVKNVTTDKTKNTLVDKVKNTTVDKTKTVVADKTKNISTADKTKVLASADKTKKAVVEKKPDVKTKVMKSSTLSTATRVTSDKTSRVTGAPISGIKKETTETTKTTSTVTKSTRPATLTRANVLASKPASATGTDRGVSSKVATKPKVTSATTETKSAVKTTSSTLSKGQTISQTKSSTLTTRITPARSVTTTVPNKTSTIVKSAAQKSVSSESKPKPLASTATSALRKPLTNTIKKSEVKEVKDSVNKQIVAKKNTVASKTDSSSTLMSRRVASASTKSTVTRVASSTAKSDGSKKDVPKAPGSKAPSKNVVSKVSQDSSSKGKEKKVELDQSKTEETKNTLNIESDQKNVTEIVQVAGEKFTLETSDKEMLTKEKCEVSSEEKKIEGNLTSPVSPVEDKTPNVECSPESL